MNIEKAKQQMADNTAKIEELREVIEGLQSDNDEIFGKVKVEIIEGYECPWEVGDQFTIRDASQTWEIVDVQKSIENDPKSDAYQTGDYRPSRLPRVKGWTVWACKVRKSGELARTKTYPNGYRFTEREMKKAEKA